jgi:elongation of very long chain fatty acids protein 4
MSWLDNVSMKFMDPYNAIALSKYRELVAVAPPAVQAPLAAAEGWYNLAMATQDPRVKDWPLMNPFHNLALVLGYLVTIFVLVQIMKRVSKPFPTKYLALWHNLFCTLLSLYMCVEIWRLAFINRYNIFSQSIDRTPNGLPMASVLWVFYASKVPEFFDTVLMALKQNFHQITFLHVYHHSSIFVIWWFIMSYVPGGSSYFSAALNSFVHVIMYGYYLWSSLAAKPVKGAKPTMLQPAFYRKYITSFQLFQFCCNFAQASYMLFVNPPADFAMFTVWILFFYMITMLALFGNFFLKAYSAPKGGKVDVANKKAKKDM